MTGKIIKGIAGFYYVNDGENRVYQCRAKGIFRNRKIKPLVGDNVEFSILDEEAGEGNIDEILPRKNALVRPAAANGANEESVRLFLNGKIKFTDIAVLNRAAMEACPQVADYTLDDVLQADRAARDYVIEAVS